MLRSNGRGQRALWVLCQRCHAGRPLLHNMRSGSDTSGVDPDRSARVRDGDGDRLFHPGRPSTFTPAAGRVRHPTANRLPPLAAQPSPDGSSAALPAGGLRLRELFPLRDWVADRTWWRGPLGLFAAFAAAPFLLIRTKQNDNDMTRAAWGFAVYFALMWSLACTPSSSRAGRPSS